MKRRPKAGPTILEPAEPASAVPAVHECVTLSNLQTAYRGETSANARYLAFARGADDEGYAPVASLFRAAARAEEIHAKNHREAILSLGASAEDTLDPPVVRSTYENLQVAIQAEVYERDEIYPTFLHHARAEKNQLAAKTFHLAQKAENEHAALFKEALEELSRLRGGAVTYYVCPVCGFTAAKANGSRCPVCSAPALGFDKVS